jgi:hypothetical protein
MASITNAAEDAQETSRAFFILKCQSFDFKVGSVVSCHFGT